MPSQTSVSNEVFLSDPQQIGALRRILDQSQSGADSRFRLDVPAELFPVLVNVLEHLAQGRSVSVVPHTQTLTTQLAANVLGVSRQFFVRLLDQGKLPFHNVGTHRRVYLTDVLAFRDQRDERRHNALRELSRQQVRDGSYDDAYVPDASLAE